MTLVVAHRLSTIKDADKILVLDSGKVAEEGDHSSLLKHGGIYAELVSKQETVEVEEEEAKESSPSDNQDTADILEEVEETSSLIPSSKKETSF